jgi:hypothetical protein
MQIRAKRLLSTLFLVASIFFVGCGGPGNGGGGSNGSVTSAIDLAISQVRSGTFGSGSFNNTIIISITNVGSAATEGVTTVTDNLPTGLVGLATGLTGVWNCGNVGQVVTILTCTDQNSIVAGATTTITLMVGVTAGPGTVSNTATVSTSGDNNAANNMSTDTFVRGGCAGSHTGNEPVLRGQYAVLAQGFSGDGTPAAVVASFTADGQGHITGGEADLNNSTAPEHLTINFAGSLYTVGGDNRACLQLAYSGGTTTAAVFRFALGGVSGGVASRGWAIEFDGTRVSGILRLQDPTAFTTAQLQPNYALGADGVDSAGRHTSIAGSINVASGSVQYDLDEGGPLAAQCVGAGHIASISGTTGRGLLTLTPGCAFVVPAHEALYVVNANEIFIIQIDQFAPGLQFGGGSVIISGRAVATGSSFSSSSLSGSYILHMTGQTGGVAHVSLGLLTFTPGSVNTGTVGGTLFSEPSGATTPVTSASYTVDPASGRVTFSGTGVGGLIAYLATPTDGVSSFIIGEPDDVFGVLEFQPSQTYTTSGLAGTYFLGTEDPGDNTVTDETGAIGPVGGDGFLSGIIDQSMVDGSLDPDQRDPIFGGLSISSDGTGDIGGSSVAITNGTKIFVMEGLGHPAVINVLEK